MSEFMQMVTASLLAGQGPIYDDTGLGISNQDSDKRWESWVEAQNQGNLDEFIHEILIQIPLVFTLGLSGLVVVPEFALQRFLEKVPDCWECTPTRFSGKWLALKIEHRDACDR